MEKKPINPWQWQDNLGFSQAIQVSGGKDTLYCAGQASIGPEGTPLHKDDMRAQIELALDNLETVLTQGGYNWSNVARLSVYTTDVDRFFGEYAILTSRLESVVPKPAITLLGVARLAFPELLLEIEATAVK